MWLSFVCTPCLVQENKEGKMKSCLNFNWTEKGSLTKNISYFFHGGMFPLFIVVSGLCGLNVLSF